MNELSKSLMCIQMRSGVEIWVEADRVQQLQLVLDKLTGSKFIHFDDQTINTADIVGIFKATTMELHTRRKNGEWQCGKGRWHAKGQQCDCSRAEVPNWTKLRFAGKNPVDN